MRSFAQIVSGLALTLALSCGVMQANVINGSIGIADIGAPSVSPGSNINTATQFNFGDLVTTGSQTGAFTGLGGQFLGSASLKIGVPGSVTFGDAVFGSFTSTSITEASNVSGSVSFYVLGNYTLGSFFGGNAGVTESSSFTVSFTQTPAETGAISDSGTFADPPTTPPPGVPEPATMGVFGSALIGLGFIGRRRKK